MYFYYVFFQEIYNLTYILKYIYYQNILLKKNHKKTTSMKSLALILLMFLGETLASPARPKETLLLVCQGNEEFSRENPHIEQVLLMGEEVESLIKSGSLPVVIECDRNVAWVYLNDPYDGRDYPVADFKSDYFETLDLFPLKLTKKLKKMLKKGNKKFLETLGVEYIIKNGEVFSKINYNKFEAFAF